ncbi:MAG: sugar ABC transporter ATP-binding protein [Desulfobacteraceae bacterium]|nr:sugar ABC transporter ATP-binding protein [Desulfobacteraceae bacterium]
MTPLLSLKNITKEFPGVKALDSVRLNLYPGKIMALVGENGAGKSTIVKILTGIYQSDEGEITIDNRTVHFKTPHDARHAGISVIHQETIMFDNLSVCENIFMGHQLTKPNSFLLDWKEMKKRTEELLNLLEVNFTHDTILKDLSVAQKHMVEIAKALSYETRIVIMDEPTAALSLNEIRELNKIIERLKSEGKAILFISHKFEEIFAIADSYTVLRDGQYIGDGNISDINTDSLIKMMVGRDLKQVFPKKKVSFGETVLKVSDLSNETEFDSIDFTLRKGEILGFYGLVGAGRSEMAQALFGITSVTRGEISINGKKIIVHNPKDAIKSGIAYVPEDRQLQGAILEMSIQENITLPQLEKVNQGVVLNRDREKKVSDTYGKKLSIKSSDWEQKVGELSGGNQQKVVLSKWLATNPDILILDEPTKGIDVGSKSAVHEIMGSLVEQGLGVILISSELPEIMGISDTIIVMHEGLIKQKFSRNDTSAEEIVATALGTDYENIENDLEN